MAKYQIKYPTGRTQTLNTEGAKTLTHVVAIKFKGKWEVWGGHVDRREAYDEAAYLVAYARYDDVTVLPATKV